MVRKGDEKSATPGLRENTLGLLAELLMQLPRVCEVGRYLPGTSLTNLLDA